MTEIRIFGERIKQIRAWRDWSQGQVAYKAQTTSAQVSRIENNERPGAQAVLLGRIAKALETSVDYLLGLTDFPSPVDIELADEDPGVAQVTRMVLERLPRLPHSNKLMAVNWLRSIIDLSDEDVDALLRMEPERAGTAAALYALSEPTSDHDADDLVGAVTDVEREVLIEMRRNPPEFHDEVLREVKRLGELRIRIIGGEEEETEKSPRGERNQTQI